MSDDTVVGLSRKHPKAECENCTLNQPINTFVAGTGDTRATIAIVGEGPGYQEAKKGIPFTGPSGQLLNAVLIDNKIAPGSTWMTNAVLCRPPDNRTPTMEEVKCCRPRLIDELWDLGELESVVTLGNTSARSLLDTWDEGITSVRVGPPKTSAYLREGVEVIPTVHPAAALRQGDWWPFIATDFKKLDRSNRVKWQEPAYKVFDDESESVRVLGELVERTDITDIVIDIEVGIEKDTDFDHPERYQFLCVGIGYERGKVIVVGEEALKHDSVRDALDAVLVSKRVWCHNGKFDLAGLTGLGIVDIPLAGDTMLDSYITDERQGTHKLGDLAVEILGAPDWKHALDEWIGSGKKKASYALVPRDILYKYNAFDVSCTFDLKLYYDRIIPNTHPKWPELRAAYGPISSMLQHVETKGIRVDMEYNRKIRQEYETMLEEQEMYLAKWVANPRSPLQVKKALYDMGVRTDSTDDLHLELILRKVNWESDLGKFVLAMRRYRSDQKMYGTYIKGMSEAIYKGRLHGNFLLHGTTSGRWACKKPNLLNIPRGPKIKTQFMPDEGCVWVQGDLKTAELRVIAIEANCPWLIDVLSDPSRDIHGEVSEQRYGPNWTKEQRIRAKAVVFGLGYGREAESIAIEFDMSVVEAQEVIDSFFELIPEVRAWQADISKRVLGGEDLVNGFGRMRRFHLITKQNAANVRREALSFLPQSTANDINMRAAATLWKQGVDVRLCVHDSVLANAKPDEAQDVANLIKTVHMETALQYSDRIPFYSDTSIGNNWGELS